MDDLDNLVCFANNFRIARNMMNRFPHPYSKDDGRAFISQAMSASPVNVFAIEVEGAASGGIGLHLQPDIYCRNAELGYWLAEPFWGRGIVARAIAEMVEYGFQTWEINRIFARPFGTNTASQRVLEKSGFILEARFEKTIFKNGEFLDELVYAIRR